MDRLREYRGRRCRSDRGRGVSDSSEGSTSDIRLYRVHERFARTMARLPSEARRPGSPYHLKSLPADDRLEVLAVFRDYFNMCSEELWLHSVGRIDKATWQIWRDGIKEGARTPAFGEAWEDLRDEYHYYPKFTRFMDELIGSVAKDEKAQLPPGTKAEATADSPNG